MNIIDSISATGIVSIRDALLQRQAQGQKIYRLESGDPSFNIASHISDAMKSALDAGHTHYTAGAGIPLLREAIAEKLKQANGIDCTAKDVFVTNGAMHGLYITFRALLEPGDEVIIPDPTWTETADNIKLAGGVVVPCELYLEEQYELRPERLKALVTDKTKAIVSNSPHNPTGAVYSLELLNQLLKFAREHNLWIVSDEAYEHVIFDGNKHYSIGSLPFSQNVISIFSMSKSYAMSGLRVGYVVTTTPWLQERIGKLLRCTINGVNSVAQAGALAALTGPQERRAMMLIMYQSRRDMLLEGLKEHPYLEAWKPQGAFYLWLRFKPAWSADAWGMSQYLLDAGIGSAPGDVFGKAGQLHIRLAFSCNTSDVAQAAYILGKATYAARS